MSEVGAIAGQIDIVAAFGLFANRDHAQVSELCLGVFSGDGVDSGERLFIRDQADRIFTFGLQADGE